VKGVKGFRYTITAWKLRILFYKTTMSTVNYLGIYIQHEKLLTAWIILGKDINSWKIAS